MRRKRATVTATTMRTTVSHYGNGDSDGDDADLGAKMAKY